MPAPPLRAATLYLRNDSTVDTGTGIDIRELIDTSGTDDASQTVQFANTNDGQHRTFDPATGAVTANESAHDTLRRKGYAVTAANFSPSGGISRQAILAAQTVTVTLNVAHAWTGTLLGSTTLAPTASLWRYNPSTDAGTLIAGDIGAGVAWTLLESGTVKDLTVALTVPSTVAFAAGETMLLQVGVQGVTLGDPVIGSSTHTSTLWIKGAARSRMVCGTIGLRTRDLGADTATGVGGSNRLTANEAGFETSAPAGWTPTAGVSLSQEGTVPAAQGSKSLRLTSTAGGNLGVYGPGKTAAPGDVVHTEMWARAVSTGRFNQLGLEAFTAGFVSLGATFGLIDGLGAVTSVSSAWKRMSLSATMPASTAYVFPFVVVYSTVTSEAHLIDAAYLGPRAVGVRVRPAKSATGVGVASKVLRGRKAVTSTGVGVAGRNARVRHAATPTGVGAGSKGSQVRKSHSADAVGLGSKELVRVRKSQSPAGVGVSDFARSLMLARSAETGAVGEAGFSRTVIFVRQFEVDGEGTADGRIGLAFDDLPEPEGGTTVVRRPILVFDD